MKTITAKMLFKKQIISALNTTNIKGGLKRATQSDQAPTGCNTNCKTDDCHSAQKQ